MRGHAYANLEGVRLSPQASQIGFATLSIRNFRCLESLDWTPGPGTHVIVGANGAGKTSILEAIYFLATTKSFRAGRSADCLNWRAKEFWVHGRLEIGDLSAGFTEGRTRKLADGKSVSAASYLSRLPAISWSTSDAHLLDGNQALRRKLLDQGVVSQNPLAIDLLKNYRKVLLAKRELLRTGSRAGLDQWNELLARYGAELIALRRAYARELDREFETLRSELDLEVPRITFEYGSNPATGEMIEDFKEALDEAAAAEVRRRRVLVGPHLDRLRIRWIEADIGRTASAGERKLFGLTLAAARERILSKNRRPPVVLIDDLDAELDQRRLEISWKLFSDLPSVVVSSANEGLLSRLENTTPWRLENASLTRL